MTDKNQFAEKFRRLATDELVRIVTDDADEYVDSALDIARNELRRRGVSVASREEAAELDSETVFQSSDQDVVAATTDREKTCRDCGGKLRYASLQATTEVVLSFFDTHDLRFVEVDVCTKCRKVTLRADLETEV